MQIKNIFLSILFVMCCALIIFMVMRISEPDIRMLSSITSPSGISWSYVCDISNGKCNIVREDDK